MQTTNPLGNYTVTVMSPCLHHTGKWPANLARIPEGDFIRKINQLTNSSTDKRSIERSIEGRTLELQIEMML